MSEPIETPKKKKKRNTHRKNAFPLLDHTKIQAWVESRGGSPATVKGSGGPERVGILRIDFPGYSGKTVLEKITWEEFFKKFEERELAFLCQESTVEGTPSRFWKLVKRNAPVPT
jgi:hypothetical protein